ncbi:MAG: aldo/keto reductase, partial [Verrucomicrobia bacterium]|nr:aldo/keto reductase [Verrucomicrobiota bacterium]
TTKITLGPKDGSGSIINKATHCLNRLRLRKVSNLLLHNEERLNQSDAKSISLKMAKLIEDGYADRVGVSSYEPGRALWLCRKYRFNVVQLPANVWDDRLFKARLLEQFFEMGVLVQVRSLLLQGILVADPQKKEVPQFLKKRLKAFQAKCSRQGLSPLEAAIGHIAKKSERLRVVVGICKKKELKSLLLAFAKKRSLKLQSKTKNLSWFDLRNWKFTEEI